MQIMDKILEIILTIKLLIYLSSHFIAIFLM